MNQAVAVFTAEKNESVDKYIPEAVRQLQKANSAPTQSEAGPSAPAQS